MRASPRRYAFCGLALASDFPLPPLRPTTEPPACTVSLVRGDTPIEPVAWFHQWRRGRGPAWLAFGRHRDGYVLRFAAQRVDFLVSRRGDRIIVRPGDSGDPAHNVPLDTLQHLLIDQVLPLAASRRGHLALHASAVHVGGFGTIGFVGETGRGKSTLAAALAAAGARLVADDCLSIDSSGRVPRATPAYPGLRLWPGGPGASLLHDASSRRVAHYSNKQRLTAGAAFRRDPSPLRALFLLSPRTDRGAAAAVRACGPSARLMGLLKYAYVLDVEDRAELAAMFDAISTVAAVTPLMRLRVRGGRRHLLTAASRIVEFARRMAVPGAPVLPS